MVCGDRRCRDVATCAAYFEARSWMDCPECEGTGYDSTGFQIWCHMCEGGRLVEAGIGDTAGVRPGAEWVTAPVAVVA
ncbi:hypothetical protein PV417_08260 [Streptomyces sp. ME19-03-3]|nr:hypothetical protein [Streptomyces sp. ME19-03-3]